jgi:hypothetical protein
VKFSDTLRGLLRRWYIVFPGILVIAGITVGVWFAVPPGYSRSATQLLIPGETSIPEGANPYLYLGGLAPAADVLVRALGSENVLNEMEDDHHGVDVKILRDTTTAGPIIVINVLASTDADAESVLGLLTARTATLLEQFQREEDIPPENRMTVIPVTVDEQSTLEQRSRILLTAGVAATGVVLVLLIAGLVDGFVQQRKRTLGDEAHDEDATGEPPQEDEDDDAAARDDEAGTVAKTT